MSDAVSSRRSRPGRQAWGATQTVLWVFASNEPALRFYARLGFSIVAEGPDAEAGYQYGASAMTRPIPSPASAD